MAPIITVRGAEPRDMNIIEVMFRDGMTSTIDGGLKRKIVGAACFLAVPIVLCLLLAGGVLAGQGERAAAALFASDTWNVIAAMPAFIGFIFGAAWLLIPPHVARDYVRKSLQFDYVTHLSLPVALGTLVPFYLGEATPLGQDPGFRIWVATAGAGEDATVVGTVAAEVVNPEHEPRDGDWRWNTGDVELRRMVVSPAWRKKGVAMALYRAVERYAAASPSIGRVVLSTSDLQRVACKRLYPSLGFRVVHKIPMVCRLVWVHFFAREVGRSGRGHNVGGRHSKKEK